MKIKFKILAIAAATILTSMTASATINVSSSPDLLFVAWDYVTGDTYVRDLGVSPSVLSTSQTFNAPTSSIFASTFAGVDPTTIQWNVIALDNTTPATYTTGDITTLGGLFNTDVKIATNAALGSLGGFTQLDDPTRGYSKGNGEYTGSKNLTDVSNASTLVNAMSFGDVTSGQGVGSSQNFIEISGNTPGGPKSSATLTQLYVNSTLAAFDNNDAGAYFTLTDANGDLTWTNAAAVAAVPLPAAAFLFAPGLLGMVGLGRRRQNKAA